MDDRPIRVLLADDHAMVREGMAEIISTDEGMEVVGQAANGAQAVELARKSMPDVVVLDVDMPVMGAQAALRRILDFSSSPKVIIVTVFADLGLVRELIDLGASAYLVKSAPMDDLLATIRAVFHSENRDNVILSAPREILEGAKRDGDCPLSDRELEVLTLTAGGMSKKKVAADLYLSEATVKRHLANVYAKLEVGSREKAAEKALAEGWISARDVFKSR